MLILITVGNVTAEVSDTRLATGQVQVKITVPKLLYVHFNNMATNLVELTFDEADLTSIFLRDKIERSADFQVFNNDNDQNVASTGSFILSLRCMSDGSHVWIPGSDISCKAKGITKGNELEYNIIYDNIKGQENRYSITVSFLSENVKKASPDTYEDTIYITAYST